MRTHISCLRFTPIAFYRQALTVGGILAGSKMAGWMRHASPKIPINSTYDRQNIVQSKREQGFPPFRPEKRYISRFVPFSLNPGI